MPPRPRSFNFFNSRLWRKAKQAMLSDKKKIGQKLVYVRGGEGARIFPPNNSKNNAAFGLRIDRGSPLSHDPNKIKVYLQANKETKDPGLQDIIRKSKRGTHPNIAEATIDTTKPSEKKVEDMIDDLEKVIPVMTKSDNPCDALCSHNFDYCRLFRIFFFFC